MTTMSSSLLVSFLITLLMAGAVCIQGQEEPVRDTAGNSLEIGQRYFIRPVPVNNGGGLVPSSRGFPLCPLDISQALLPILPGYPVSFTFANSDTDTIVTTSTDVTIEFTFDNFWPFCDEYSKIWEVDNTSSVEHPLVLIGGQRGSINSTFQIVKIGQGAEPIITYKLTTFLGNVATVPGFYGNAPKLVVTGDDNKALKVTFKKVDDTTTSTSRIDKLGLRMFPFY